MQYSINVFQYLCTCSEVNLKFLPSFFFPEKKLDVWSCIPPLLLSFCPSLLAHGWNAALPWLVTATNWKQIPAGGWFAYYVKIGLRWKRGITTLNTLLNGELNKFSNTLGKISEFDWDFGDLVCGFLFALLVLTLNLLLTSCRDISTFINLFNIREAAGRGSFVLNKCLLCMRLWLLCRF